MSRGYSINQGGFSNINFTSPFAITCRVDFDGTTYVANTPYVDTKLLPNLAGATTAQLLETVGPKGNFTEGFGIYRKAGGANTSSTQAIQLAKCVETCTVYGYATVFTGLTSSATTLSIGVTGQNQALLGSQPTSALTTSSNIWINTFPAAGTFPNQTSTVGASATFYPLPELVIASGNTLNLYLGTGATPITEGSLNIHLKFGSLSEKIRNKTHENETIQNIRVGPAIPKY